MDVTTEQSPQLRALAVEWWDAFPRGDGEWFARHVSSTPETRLAGTDAEDWFRGKQVAEFLVAAVNSLAGTLKVSPGEPEAFQAGEVGWVCSRPVITVPDGPPVKFRWSVVFRREHDVWKAVQVHASAAIPDEVLLRG